MTGRHRVQQGEITDAITIGRRRALAALASRLGRRAADIAERIVPGDADHTSQQIDRAVEQIRREDGGAQ